MLLSLEAVVAMLAARESRQLFGAVVFVGLAVTGAAAVEVDELAWRVLMVGTAPCDLNLT